MPEQTADGGPTTEEEQQKTPWWRQKRWWIIGALLLVLAIADVVAAFAVPRVVSSGIASTADRLKAEGDLRTSILGLLGLFTPVVALIAGGAALLNFQETRNQNERTFKTTQQQLEEARTQNQRMFETTQSQLEAAGKQFKESHELQHRGQVTERFTKAIEQLGQLGPETLAARLGGIYALEQIALDSEELHWPIMEVPHSVPS